MMDHFFFTKHESSKELSTFDWGGFIQLRELKSNAKFFEANFHYYLNAVKDHPYQPQPCGIVRVSVNS